MVGNLVIIKREKLLLNEFIYSYENLQNWLKNSKYWG